MGDQKASYMNNSINKYLTDYENQIITMQLNITNLSNFDRKIIFTDLLNDKELFNNFKLKEIEKRMSIFFNEIRGISVKPNKMSLLIKKSEEENMIVSLTHFDYNKFYISPLMFPYTFKSNSLYLKINYDLYNNRFSFPETRMKEIESSAGYLYGFNKSKHTFFLSNLMFFNLGLKDLELLTKYKNSKSILDTKRKQHEKDFKLEIAKNLTERPFIFRENFSYDIINKVALQISHKIIENSVDTNDCSNELKCGLPIVDSQNRLKLYYLYNITNLAKKEVCYFKLGSTLVHSINSLFLHNKLFFRKIFLTEPFSYQFNFEIGNVYNLGKEDLKIHEKLLVHNFRGINSPSRKAVIHEGKFLF
jgi:hypothetical protein